jgi:hypothetical protein
MMLKDATLIVIRIKIIIKVIYSRKLAFNKMITFSKLEYNRDSSFRWFTVRQRAHLDNISK